MRKRDSSICSPTRTKKYFNIYDFSYKQVLTSIPFDLETGTLIKNAGHPEIIKDITNRNPQEIVSIFTDGSKIKEANCVGAACYCPQLEIKFKKV